MSEYRSVTHTIVELLSRKKIQAVPRKRNVKRTELDNVGRPDDDRKNSEVPTRQGEIIRKVIDEANPVAEDAGIQSVATEPAKGPGPDKARKAKKLEIQDVGKQPPTKVEINPELDNTPNIFSSKEEKGKLVEGEWKPPDMKAIKARREAEHIAKFASSLKSFGGFKVTGKLTPKDIEQGAQIRARLNKLKEATNQYNNVSIQYQTRGGIWVTARKTSNDPADIMLAMRNVQKVYSQNRVRAIGGRGMVLDFQPIDPQNIATEGVVSAGMKNTAASGGISAALAGLKKEYPKIAGAIDKIQSGYASVTKFSPGYATFAGQKDVLPAKIVTDYIEKNRAKKAEEQKAANEGTQVSPGVQTIEKVLRKIMEARHSGIETDEPKFNQSIQKVASHAKIYTDVEHTYKHKDGSKTRVNQKLGEKIHRTIHSTPHRHRADLIQKMHSSADNLKHALKEGKSNPAPFDMVGYLKRGKGGAADRFHRSGEAKALENPVFRNKIVKDKTTYTRKEKHKGKEND